jgi:hypothetical protein
VTGIQARLVFAASKHAKPTAEERATPGSSPRYAPLASERATPGSSPRQNTRYALLASQRRRASFPADDRSSARRKSGRIYFAPTGPNSPLVGEWIAATESSASHSDREAGRASSGSESSWGPLPNGPGPSAAREALRQKQGSHGEGSSTHQDKGVKGHGIAAAHGGRLLPPLDLHRIAERQVRTLAPRMLVNSLLPKHALETHIYACVHTYIHTHIRTYMHACMHACIQKSIYPSIHLSICQSPSIHLSIYPSIHLSIYVCVCVCVRERECVCMLFIGTPSVTLALSAFSIHHRMCSLTIECVLFLEVLLQ